MATSLRLLSSVGVVFLTILKERVPRSGVLQILHPPIRLPCGFRVRPARPGPDHARHARLCGQRPRRLSAPYCGRWDGFAPARAARRTPLPGSAAVGRVLDPVGSDQRVNRGMWLRGSTASTAGATSLCVDKMERMAGVGESVWASGARWCGGPAVVVARARLRSRAGHKEQGLRIPCRVSAARCLAPPGL